MKKGLMLLSLCLVLVGCATYNVSSETEYPVYVDSEANFFITVLDKKNKLISSTKKDILPSFWGRISFFTFLFL